jgi:hypothetical protein
MIERQQVVVTVAADGTVRAETRGVVGERCLDYVAILEDLIDGRTTESSYTADWARQEAAEHVVERQEDRDVERP